MKLDILNVYGTWRQIANSANTTINKEVGEKEPSSKWKLRLLYSEHSPIRKLKISAKWYGLKSWVSVHLVRHKFGIEHFVRTQRTDRTGEDRNALRQDALVEHEIEADAQAIINISRRRLCYQASPETIEAWSEFLNKLSEYEPELSQVCVKECVYRNGLCPEFKTCGYNFTDKFKDELIKYTECLKEQISVY